MAQFWFKPKKYGWGTYPTVWQGWTATLVLVLLIMVSFYINIIQGRVISADLKDWLRYGLDVIILTTLFLVVFKDKVEGGLRWRWGKELIPK